jgi:hypothetical protein
MKQNWFFEKINNIEKPLAKLVKWKREKTQINKIRDKKGDKRIKTNEIQRSLGDMLKTYISINWKNIKKWANI